MGKYIRRRRRDKLFRRFAALVLPGVAVLAMLSQPVLAKTYVITDGNRVVTCTTFATDPAQVLEAAGMTLADSDSYTTQSPSEITITRADRVTVRYHGEEFVIASGQETVGQLLDRLDLTVGEGDVLSHSPETPVFDGMALHIDCCLTREETYTTAVPFEIRYCSDPSLPEGMEQVLVRGRDGELLYTAQVSYRNGTEVSRQVTASRMTIAPVKQIVARGTGTPEGRTEQEGELVIGDGFIRLPTGEVLTYTRTDTVRATAYTHTDAGCDRITATGTEVRVGTVAVDPRFIPYGTRMFIVSNDGEYVYGLAVAEDCGGAIKRDRMDLYFPTYEECMAFGFRSCTIYFLG